MAHSQHAMWPHRTPIRRDFCQRGCVRERHVATTEWSQQENARCAPERTRDQCSKITINSRCSHFTPHSDLPLSNIPEPPLLSGSEYLAPANVKTRVVM